VNNVKEFMKMVGHSEDEELEDEEEEREERIQNEIIVDAYGPEEQALGWHVYLSEKLHFPFSARCVVRREISPLEPGEEVEVVGMASDEECMHEMFVLIRWKRRRLAVPLMQLEGIQVDEETRQAIEDWRYWVKQGYEL
jgi:calcium binding protein